MKISQHELNKQIEALILTKDENQETYSKEELKFIGKYEGSGGQASKGATGQGLLHEFYTPDYICKLMWDLARKHGYTGGKVLEPALGTGRLIKYANKPSDVVGFEINPVSARIAELTNQSRDEQKGPTIYNEYFETAFLKAPRYTERINSPVTWLKEYPFSLVIGNPPYGVYKSYYSSFFKKPKLLQVEHFFMYYGLKLLKKDGVMVFITASSFMDNGDKYDSFRRELERICQLEEAFRLPPVFLNSQVPTDILIFRKLTL